MENKGKRWLIAIVVLAVLYFIGSCDNSSSSSGTRHQGICSHCCGAGKTSTGVECAWCDGYGFWAYYD